MDIHPKTVRGGGTDVSGNSHSTYPPLGARGVAGNGGFGSSTKRNVGIRTLGSGRGKGGGVRQKLLGKRVDGLVVWVR